MVPECSRTGPGIGEKQFFLYGEIRGQTSGRGECDLPGPPRRSHWNLPLPFPLDTNRRGGRTFSAPPDGGDFLPKSKLPRLEYTPEPAHFSSLQLDSHPIDMENAPLRRDHLEGNLLSNRPTEKGPAGKDLRGRLETLAGKEPLKRISFRQ